MTAPFPADDATPSTPSAAKTATTSERPSERELVLWLFAEAAWWASWLVDNAYSVDEYMEPYPAALPAWMDVKGHDRFADHLGPHIPACTTHCVVDSAVPTAHGTAQRTTP